MVTLTILAMVVASSVGCGRTENGPPATSAPLPATSTPRSTPGSTPGSAPPARAGWAPLAASPLANRSGFTSVWTGTELLVCCGTPKRTESEGAGPTAPPAALYNPTTDSWRAVAGPPVPVESWGAITVVDETIYFFDGGTAPWSYAAYDIPTGAWRAIPSPPGNQTRAPSSRLGPSAWTGTEIVAPIATPPIADNDLVMVAFDPATNTWRTLPSPPTRVEPASLMHDAGTLTLLGEVRSAADQASSLVSQTFDTSTNTWGESQQTPIDRRGPQIAGGGERVVAWDVSGAVRVRQNGQWRDLPTIPFPEDECGWKGSQLGRRLVLWRCTQQGAVLDLDTEQWSVLPNPPVEISDGNITTVNGRLLLWAGATDHLQPYALEPG